MLPRNEPVVPSFPVYPPIDVFLETRGNKRGNEIVSSLESSPCQRGGFPKVETRISALLETKHPKKGPFRFLSFPCREPS
jgi:hypothetical protein